MHLCVKKSFYRLPKMSKKDQLLCLTLKEVARLTKLKGGLSDLGANILQKYQKIILILPKPFNFHSLNPSSEKPSNNKRNWRITTA